MAKIDSHLHVWTLDDERYPMLPGRVPNVPGDVERLLSSMDEADIDGALIVQPIFHGFDHGYVNQAIKAHPDRFKGMALINPQRMDAVDQLDRLVTDKGYSGVRFNPAMWVLGVIEHLDLSHLPAFERSVFEFARPGTVVITTPNADYNVRWPSLPAGRFRHDDHRFAWTRVEFEAWARQAADRFDYRVRFEPIGPHDAEVGAPTQMAVFTMVGG